MYCSWSNILQTVYKTAIFYFPECERIWPGHHRDAWRRQMAPTHSPAEPRSGDEDTFVMKIKVEDGGHPSKVQHSHSAGHRLRCEWQSAGVQGQWGGGKTFLRMPQWEHLSLTFMPQMLIWDPMLRFTSPSATKSPLPPNDILLLTAQLDWLPSSSHWTGKSTRCTSL